MKILLPGIPLAFVFLLCCADARAQYKGPRDYFPKNNTVPGVTNPSAPKTPGNQTPGTPATPSSPGAVQQSKFKDVAVNGQFYFLADTNRAYAWMKITGTTAKNTKNGVTQTINAETPVRR